MEGGKKAEGDKKNDVAIFWQFLGEFSVTVHGSKKRKERMIWRMQFDIIINRDELALLIAAWSKAARKLFI